MIPNMKRHMSNGDAIENLLRNDAEIDRKYNEELDNVIELVFRMSGKSIQNKNELKRSKARLSRLKKKKTRRNKKQAHKAKITNEIFKALRNQEKKRLFYLKKQKERVSKKTTEYCANLQRKWGEDNENRKANKECIRQERKEMKTNIANDCYRTYEELDQEINE